MRENLLWEGPHTGVGEECEQEESLEAKLIPHPPVPPGR